MFIHFSMASYMLVYWRVMRWTYCLASPCGLVVPPHFVDMLLTSCYPEVRCVSCWKRTQTYQQKHWYLGWERFVQTHAFGIWMLLDHGWTCGAVSPKLISNVKLSYIYYLGVPDLGYQIQFHFPGDCQDRIWRMDSGLQGSRGWWFGKINEEIPRKIV